MLPHVLSHTYALSLSVSVSLSHTHTHFIVFVTFAAKDNVLLRGGNQLT